MKNFIRVRLKNQNFCDARKMDQKSSHLVSLATTPSLKIPILNIFLLSKAITVEHCCNVCLEWGLNAARYLKA